MTATETVPFATNLADLAAPVKSDQVVKWSPDDFLTVATRLGRNYGPMLLEYVGEELPHDTLAVAVSEVWTMVEYPDAALSHERWRYWWRETGFTSDGITAPRPTEPMRLYRGAVALPAYRRRDWSWSDDRAVAERFAVGGLGGRPAGVVWTALVPPQHILGFISGRNESEWVVDTRGLTIAEAPDVQS